MDRVLGSVRGPSPGPTLLCVGGVHGNEWAGIRALERVLEALEARSLDLEGELVALAGNRAALASRRRFVDRDLNRCWTDERVRRLRGGGLGDDTEDEEQMELLGEIDDVLQRARGPVFALDLHTTSGPGGIFSAFSDALPHRDFAAHFPVPMIFGLEEQVDGTLLNLLSEHGLIAVTVESGQHDEPAAVDRSEAAVWIAIVSAGLLPEHLVPEASAGRKLLGRDTAHLPRALEMRYRHPVEEGDGFTMLPGYRNFQDVTRGEVIATDDTGELAVIEDSKLLMPLYQEQGEDGYFLVREFRPFWMHVSYILRRIRADRLTHWLPGVRRAPADPDVVIVDRRIARLFARQLFHLLGFRRIDEEPGRLVMRRRPFDEARYLRRPPKPKELE